MGGLEEAMRWIEGVMKRCDEAPMKERWSGCVKIVSLHPS
jgi:hypothetical protein